MTSPRSATEKDAAARHANRALLIALGLYGGYGILRLIFPGIGELGLIARSPDEARPRCLAECGPEPEGRGRPGERFVDVDDRLDEVGLADDHVRRRRQGDGHGMEFHGPSVSATRALATRVEGPDWSDGEQPFLA